MISRESPAQEGPATRRASPFALYWTSSTVSYLGDGVRLSALPLLAVSLSSSARDVALVSAAAGLPWLLFGLAAGIVVDRTERSRAMTVLQVMRGALTLVVVAGVVTGNLTIPSLAALVFILSGCEVVFDIAAHAILPSIVDRDRLQWANGRLITAEVVAFEFIGPVLGGVLFAAGAAGAFAVDAASFLLSAVALAMVSRSVRAARTTPPSTAGGLAALRADLVEGLRWFWTRPLLKLLTMITVEVNFAAGAFYAMLALFARRELALGPIGYGLLIAVGALGSVVAGLTGQRVRSGSGRRGVVLVSAPSVCVGLVVLAAWPWWPLTALVMIAFGFAVSLYNVVAVSLRQVLTPDAMLGRVTAVHRFLAWGALPVGAMAAGFIGDWLGLQAAIGLCAIAAGLCGLLALPVLFRSPVATFAPEHASGLSHG